MQPFAGRTKRNGKLEAYKPEFQQYERYHCRKFCPFMPLFYFQNSLLYIKQCTGLN